MRSTRFIKQRGYATRSEAVGDILRGHLQRSIEKRDAKGACVANLSYVYNHHERDLAERLTTLRHAHHDLSVMAERRTATAISSRGIEYESTRDQGSCRGKQMEIRIRRASPTLPRVGPQ
jgi:hypothetical protein